MLSALFNPASVAVIGASREPGKLGHTILRNIIASGYKGKIYPINPNADTILDLKCYPDIKSTPTTVDMAIFCIPAPYVLPTLKGIVDSGKLIKAGTIISAGFRETGSEGAQWEAAINKLSTTHQDGILLAVRRLLHGRLRLDY
ncbi:MAG: CoA-binding protein [Planctomycetes bacterium]|nr:CoA-binding protein [Planctomycetota bacterium]